MSVILPAIGSRVRDIEIAGGWQLTVQQLCREEEVRFVDLWECFVGKAGMYMRDGLHLSGKIKKCSSVC